MDVNEYVSILYIHSEYLRMLAEQLVTQFAKIEETLQEQHIVTYAEAGPQVDDLIECSATVLRTAENLHQRLLAFRKKTPGDEDPSP